MFPPAWLLLYPPLTFESLTALPSDMEISLFLPYVEWWGAFHYSLGRSSFLVVSAHVTFSQTTKAENIGSQELNLSVM